MESDEGSSAEASSAEGYAKIHGAPLKVLESVFRHPTAHNLEWMNVVRLMEKIGTVQVEGNDRFAFAVGTERHVMHKPHGKDLGSSDVADLRRFLSRAGWALGAPPAAVAHSVDEPPTLVVAVDHHGAKIYRIDPSGGNASKREIKPYDPHHFLQHLAHKGQSREQGQRAPEDPGFYKDISVALAAGGKIVVVGHGTGKSNAARHLAEYLQSHHREIYQRIVREVDADLSAITPPQLLELAEGALRQTA
jgi:hypothetical protein